MGIGILYAEKYIEGPRREWELVSGRWDGRGHEGDMGVA